VAVKAPIGRSDVTDEIYGREVRMDWSSVPITAHINIKDSPRAVRPEDAVVPDAILTLGYSVRF
jgi:hypothetical protein